MSFSIHNLGFRKKLLLAAAAPIFGLLVLGSLAVNSNLEKWEAALSVAAGVERISQISTAMSEVERERRNLTGQLLGTMTTGDKGESQYPLSDRSVRALFPNCDKSKKCGWLEEHLARARHFQISEYRNAIEAYSKVLEHLLSLSDAQAQSMASADRLTSSLARSSTYLARTGEAVARQRAVLSGALLERQVSTVALQKMSAANAAFERSVEGFMLLASPETRSQLKAVLNLAFVSAIGADLQMVEEKFQLSEHIAHVRRLIGFNGLIHLFKNYLLRGEEANREAFIEKYSRFKIQLGHVQKLSSSPEDTQLIEAIDASFAMYRKNLDVVRSMRLAGRSPEEIDHIVKIDDRPATLALNQIEFRPLGVDAAAWSRNSLELISRVDHIKGQILRDLSARSRSEVSRARASVIFYVVLAGFAILVTLLLLGAVFRQLGMLALVTTRLEQLGHGHYDDGLLAARGSDEIAELSRAYNTLIRGLGGLVERSIWVASDQPPEAQEGPQKIGEGPDGRPATIANVGPLAESFAQIEARSLRLSQMAQCIANDELDSPLLEEQFQGSLGESMQLMTSKLRRLAARARSIADGEIRVANLEGEMGGTLGRAFRDMVYSLSTLAAQVHAIARGDLDNPVLGERVPGEVGEEVRALARDIVDMKQKLVTAERMSSMGMLAAGISHELNNPMSYVLGNLEWVQRELSEQNPDTEVAEAIAETLVGVRKVREISADLNLFTRSHKGAKEAVEVVVVMESAIRIATSHLRGSVSLHREFEEVPKVMAIKGKLGQVFLNLLVNAAQAITEEGGKGNIRIRVYEKGPRVCIEVIDDGPGIGETSIEQLFEPFYSTKESKGTGLGLAICRQIVNDLGGTIEASNTGTGAMFRVELPAVISQE